MEEVLRDITEVGIDTEIIEVPVRLLFRVPKGAVSAEAMTGSVRNQLEFSSFPECMFGLIDQVEERVTEAHGIGVRDPRADEFSEAFDYAGFRVG